MSCTPPIKIISTSDKHFEKRPNYLYMVDTAQQPMILSFPMVFSHLITFLEEKNLATFISSTKAFYQKKKLIRTFNMRHPSSLIENKSKYLSMLHYIQSLEGLYWLDFGHMTYCQSFGIPANPFAHSDIIHYEFKELKHLNLDGNYIGLQNYEHKFNGIRFDGTSILVDFHWPQNLESLSMRVNRITDVLLVNTCTLIYRSST